MRDLKRERGNEGALAGPGAEPGSEGHPCQLAGAGQSETLPSHKNKAVGPSFLRISFKGTAFRSSRESLWVAGDSCSSRRNRDRVDSGHF